MTFFRREGENPMKHFGSYLTIAGTVPYLSRTGGSKPPCAILFGNDLRVGLHIWQSPCNTEVTSEMFHRIFAFTPKKRHILFTIRRKVFKLQSSATVRWKAETLSFQMHCS